MENKRLTTVLIIGLFLLIFSVVGSFDNDILSGKSIYENVRALDDYNLDTINLTSGGNTFKLDNNMVGRSFSDITERMLIHNSGKILFVYNNPQGSFQCNDNGCRTIYIPSGSPWESRIPVYKKKNYYSTSAEQTIFVYYSRKLN